MADDTSMNVDLPKDGYRDLFIEGRNMAHIVKALSNEIRIQILELLENREMNIHEIQEKLGLSKTTVLMHLGVLEEAGFISTYYVPGTVGHQKFCRKEYDRLIFNFTPMKEADTNKNYYEVLVNPGNYFNFEIYPPCGLASKDNVIVRWDDPSVFFCKERVDAAMAWCAYGYLEYRIPLNIPYEDLGFSKLEIALEISAQSGIEGNRMLMFPEEIPATKLTDGISDVTFWINDMELVTCTVHSEAATKKAGKYTPAWWRGEQYGELLRIVVDEQGTAVNGVKTGDTKLSQILPESVLKRNIRMKLLMTASDCLVLRIGCKPNAEHMSGFSLFGKDFGNHSTDISVKFYR